MAAAPSRSPARPVAALRMIAVPRRKRRQCILTRYRRDRTEPPDEPARCRGKNCLDHGVHFAHRHRTCPATRRRSPRQHRLTRTHPSHGARIRPDDILTTRRSDYVCMTTGRNTACSGRFRHATPPDHVERRSWRWGRRDALSMRLPGRPLFRIALAFSNLRSACAASNGGCARRPPTQSASCMPRTSRAHFRQRYRPKARYDCRIGQCPIQVGQRGCAAVFGDCPKFMRQTRLRCRKRQHCSATAMVGPRGLRLAPRRILGWPAV